ncbi:mast cell protease 1-like [Manduca sexta]|uniref:mast cell protease 1-like n=1 Tax=Manduca sexta TaxID=7130 RepID=UPI00118271C3|nr:mast cell protease 1-like [Manduca sexta]
MKVFILYSILINSAISEYDNRIITTLKYSKHQVQPTIVNGEPAKKGEVPFLVSLKEPAYKIDEDRTVWKNLCGGSIIGELKVLTAAHCFEQNDFYYANHPRNLRIVAGDLRSDLVHSGKTDTTETTQLRKIDKVVLHNNFNFPSHDIALVFVDEKWNYTDHVDFIIPARKMTDYLNVCVTAGFGRIGHGVRAGVTPILLLAQIETMTRWKCSILWEMNMNSFICTGSVLTDVAKGDSGGPLACKGTRDPAEVPGRKLLAGVVSGKNFDRTTLYTRVSEYHDWLERDLANKINTGLNIALLFLIHLLFY